MIRGRYCPRFRQKSSFWDGIVKTIISLDDDGNNYFNSKDAFFHFAVTKAEASSPVSRLVIINDKSSPTFDQTIKNYRLRKNPNFKVFFIGSGTRYPKNTDHVIFVDGCNEQVLRYMSEAGKDDVILQIQSFPTKFGIELDAFANLSPLDVYVPRISTAKVFISSTFLDLRNQRDLLVNNIFPMINQKCLPSHGVQWVPIDIRFEENVSDEIEAVTVCLRQVAECDLLFHIQGKRYGTIPKALYRGVYPPKGLEFLKNFEEKSISITEAEVRAAIAFRKPILSISCDEISHSKSKKLQNDLKKYENTLITISNCDLDDLEKFSEAIVGAFNNPELYTDLPLENGSKKKSSHAYTDNIIGRKLLLDKASNSIFHSQVTCVYGQEKMGKTSLMKYLFSKAGFQIFIRVLIARF